MTALLDKVADLAIAPIKNLPLTSTATVFRIDDLPGDILAFPDPASQGYFAYIWNRTDFPNIGDANRNGQSERVRVTGRDVGTFELTVVRGTSPIDLNVSGKEYWIVLSMNADIIEEIDDRLWDIQASVLTTDKEISAPDAEFDKIDLLAGVGAAPINFHEDPGNGANFIALSAPAALGGSFPIVLPAVLPVITEFLTITSGGVMGTSPATTAISLDDAYNEGRIIIADVGPVEIQGAGGLQITGAIPVLLFETGAADFNYRVTAASDFWLVQRGQEDTDISDDTFITGLSYDGSTNRFSVNTNAGQDLIHGLELNAVPSRLRLQHVDNDQDISVVLQNSDGVLWEAGYDDSALAYIIGRLSFANPAIGILDSDGRVSIGKAPGVGIGDTAARLDVLNTTASLAAAFFKQQANFPAVVIKSDATNSPLLVFQPLGSTNVRGDIFFGLRSAGASTPFTGDMWFDNTNGRLEFRHASSLTRAISTPFGPNYGPTQQVSIIGVNITVSSGGHYQVSGAAFPAADVLEGIIITGAGPKDGDTIMLRMATGSGQITVSTVAGNIRLNGNSNIGLNVVNDTLVLMFSSGTSQWIQVSHSNNAI